MTISGTPSRVLGPKEAPTSSQNPLEGPLGPDDAIDRASL